MRWTALLILICLYSGLKAQNDSVRMVTYTPEFKFNDGIYMDFDQVWNNSPIPAIRIVSNDDPFDFNFYKNLVKNKTIGYFDAFGSRQEISTSGIWGYCQDGKIYIQYNGEFNRIPIIGRVCHFISNVTVIDNRYDPYYYDYYNYGSYNYGYYNNPYYYRPYSRTTRTKELRQYLLEWETGKVLTFDKSSVEILLMQDPALYDEFMSLKKKKQNELLFFFLRRLNEKNPLQVPVR